VRSLGRVVLAAAALVVLLIAAVYARQHSLIYHPRPYDSSYATALPPHGSEIGYSLPFGQQVAFYLPPRRGALPERLWVAFCGNGSLALDWTTILRGYPDNGDAFLLVDYPGYGKSAGYATIASMRDSTDAALEALADRLGTTKGELEPRLCAIGHSLGAAVALDFAARHGAQRVVAIAPFTTLREEAATVAGPLAHLLIESYDNRESLAAVFERNPAARVAIFHGVDDELIPERMGRELAQLRPASIDYIPIDGDHVSVLEVAREQIIHWMEH